MADNAVYAYLSTEIYKNLEGVKSFGASSFGGTGRFEVAQVIKDPTSGYYGAIIKDTATGEGILVHRGTNEILRDSAYANLNIMNGGPAGKQFEFINQELASYMKRPDAIDIVSTTGHSLGGFLSQMISLTYKINATAIASPGAAGAIDDLNALGYIVSNSDASRINVINDPKDPIGAYGIQLNGINYQEVDLSGLVNQALNNKMQSLFFASGVDAPNYEITLAFLAQQTGLSNHRAEFYQAIITQDFNLAYKLIDEIAFATNENGDLITRLDKITLIDSSTSSDIIFYEHSDGNTYAVFSNPDGSQVLSYKDGAGNPIIKTFESFEDTSILTDAEKDILSALKYTQLKEEGAKARELYENNPDIINSSEFNSLPNSLKQRIIEAYIEGQNLSESEDALREVITLVGETLVGEGTWGFSGNKNLGSGSEAFNVQQLVYIIQNGKKEHQIDATVDLYNKIKSEGVFDFTTGTYTLGGAKIEAYTNSHGGYVQKISYNNNAQSFITQYGAGNFQQQVIETVGLDSRTNTAQITLIDGLVKQLYHGSPITINYPEEFVFDYVGGYVGNIIGQELENGELAHDLIVRAASRTLVSNVGEFIDYFNADNTIGESLFGTIFGVDGENNPRPDVFDDLVSNIQVGVLSLVSNKIVEELGDALGLDGVAGEVFDVAAGTITTGVLTNNFGFLFNALDQTTFVGVLSGSSKFSHPFPPNVDGINGTIGDYMQFQVVNALGAFAGSRLAGEIVEPESEMAAIFGAAGSAYAAAVGTAVGAGKSLSVALTSAFATSTQLGAAAGSFVPVIGTVIGAFVGSVIGTVFGNLFGDDDEPQAWATLRYEADATAFAVQGSWASDGGDANVAQSMAQQVISGVNDIIEASHGKLRSGESAHSIRIGYEGNEFQVSINGGDLKTFGTSAGAINYAAFKLMKDFDLVGGHAIVMRAWHNSDANNIYEWLEDIQVAEAFQLYLADPASILALMMNEPESDLAQSWAAILQRAAELELHLPHEKDLDGGWGEVLLAQGVSTEFIPSLEGDSIVLTDPVTGEERVMHHVIGPGYEIVRMEGTDGDDILQVIVDGPSISYVDGGEGNDTIEGSDQVDILVGGSGEDTINGNDGNDWLHGGAGDDTLDGGAGEDLVVGGENNDLLIGDTESDQIYGNGGDDVLFGGDGKDFLYGGAGNDTLDGGDDGIEDRLNGGEGDDILISKDREVLIGGKGNDTYEMGHHSLSRVFIYREDGHDTVNLSTGVNSVHFHRDISWNELFYERDGNNLKIRILGENQSVILNNFFSSGVDARIITNGGGFALDNQGGSKATANMMANIHADYIHNLSGEYNYLDNASLAAIQNRVGVIHRKTTPDSNYQANADVYSSGSDTIWFRNRHDWVKKYQVGGAGNDILGPDDLGWAGRDYYVYGDSGNDKLYGANNKDIITGGLGNDFISGRNNHDRLFGGYGDDSIYGGWGNDFISGGHGNDVINGNQNDDHIDGGIGDDTLAGSDGLDTVNGGEGDDVITGGQGNDTLHGGEGDDAISGGLDDDTIFGDVGNDVIQGDEGNDWISGGEGDDVINGGEGDDVINGGAGNDVIEDGLGNDIVDGGEGDDTIIHVLSSDTDDISGGAGNDTLSVSLSSEEYNDLAIKSKLYDLIYNYSIVGNDSFVIDGSRFNGIENFQIELDGTSYNPVINMSVGGDEDDNLNGSSGKEYINSGLGNDRIYSSSDIDIINGGAGIDTLDFSNATSSVIVNLKENEVVNDGFGTRDFVKNIENILGSNVSDTIYGNQGNIIHGEAGNDNIHAGGGVNEIYGGLGNDNISDNANEASQNELFGEGGNDTFHLSLSSSNRINGGEGVDRVNYNYQNTLGLRANLVTGEVDKDNDGNADDILTSIEIFNGSRSDDHITGNTNNNTVYASIGNDFVRGGAGSDQLYGHHHNDIILGGSGNDIIQGQNNDDILFGQGGRDTLLGGSGSDIFGFELNSAFSDLDTINDFNIVEDKIDLADLLRNYDPITDDINNFIQITDYRNYDSILSVDVNGTGSDYQQVAIIINERNFSDLGALISDGTLIINSSYGFSFNTGPEAKNDAFIMQQGTALSGNLLADNGSGVDRDLDGDNIFAVETSLTTANGGQVTINQNGDFNYNPADNFHGDDSFEYTIRDDYGFEVSATVSLVVEKVNVAPVAQNDSFTVVEDAELSGNLLSDNGAGADSDPDGDNLSVLAATLTTALGGAVAIQSNGDFIYMPAAGFVGQDSFAYTLQDALGAETVGNVSINVTSSNEAPVANDDAFDGDQDQAVTGNVLADNRSGADSDPDGDALTVLAASITSAQGGTVSISENGEFTYTPVNGFSGADSFSYTLRDEHGAEATATVNLNIAPAPQQNTVEGTDASESLMGTTEDDIIYGYGGNDTLHGYAGNDVIYGEGGNDSIYTQQGDDTVWGGNGVDSIYLNHGINEAYGENGLDRFYVYGGVNYINGGDNPDMVYYDTYANSLYINLLDGYVDTNNDGLADDTLVSIERAKGSQHNDIIIGNSDKNILYGNGGDDILYGGDGEDRYYGMQGADRFVLEFDTAFNNQDLLMDFKPLDGDIIDIADVLRNYNPTVDDINNYVRFTDDGYHVYLHVDVNGQNNNFVNILKLVNSIAQIGPLDPIETLIENGNLVVSNVVLPINEAPVAQNDAFGGDQDQAITGNVLADNGSGADGDPDGDALTAVAASITSTQGGTVSISENGDFTYTPVNGFSGVDSFSYTLRDEHGAEATAIVSLNMAPAPQQNTIEGTDESESLMGTTEDDIIYGFGGNDMLHGYAGNDTIYGDGGNDTIYTHQGDDIVWGGDGIDTIYLNHGINEAYGESGGDTFIVYGGTNHIDGGDGSDRAFYGSYSSAIYADLLTGILDTNNDGLADDTLFSIEQVQGSQYSDTFIGDQNNNSFYGLNGDDIFYGSAGADRLYGGNGADTFVFETSTAFDVADKIFDYNVSQNDTIDISDLLSQYDPLADSLSDFVQLRVYGNHLQLDVDVDGGADNFINIVQLNNSQNINGGLDDLSTLVTNGNLIIE